jgi:hypothetical protein
VNDVFGFKQDFEKQVQFPNDQDIYYFTYQMQVKNTFGMLTGKRECLTCNYRQCSHPDAVRVHCDKHNQPFGSHPSMIADFDLTGTGVWNTQSVSGKDDVSSREEINAMRITRPRDSSVPIHLFPERCYICLRSMNDQYRAALPADQIIILAKNSHNVLNPILYATQDAYQNVKLHSVWCTTCLRWETIITGKSSAIWNYNNIQLYYYDVLLRILWERVGSAASSFHRSLTVLACVYAEFQQEGAGIWLLNAHNCFVQSYADWRWISNPMINRAYICECPDYADRQREANCSEANSIQ